MEESLGDFNMPFGIFKGKPLKEIPAYYLLWLRNQKIAIGKVSLYIEANLDALEEAVGIRKSNN